MQLPPYKDNVLHLKNSPNIMSHVFIGVILKKQNNRTLNSLNTTATGGENNRSHNTIQRANKRPVEHTKAHLSSPYRVTGQVSGVKS